MFMCNCGSSFTRVDNLTRHRKKSCKLIANKIGETSRGVKRPADNNGGNAGPAAKIAHPLSQTRMARCVSCNIDVASNQLYAHNRTLNHKSNARIFHSKGVQLAKSAFKCRIAGYRVNSDEIHIDYGTFFDSVKHRIIGLVEKVVTIHHIIKANIEVFGRYILHDQDVGDIKSFNTKNQIIDASTDLDATLAKFRDSVIAQSIEFEEKDSGWSLQEVLFVEININKYSPLGGSSYMKLPREIELKKAVINVQNRDNYCFAWAIVSALYPAIQNTGHVSSYPDVAAVLNLQGLEFPMKLKGILKFEDQNNISVNVYGVEQNFVDGKMKHEIVGPLRYSQRRLRFHINLLLITDETGNSHYCWIKDLSKLVSKQINNYEHKKFFCDGCLLYFTTENILLRHQSHDCNHVYTTTPTVELIKDKRGLYVPGNQLKFQNFDKQLKVPFVVYADFESALKPIASCQPNDKASYTVRTHVHEAYSFAYLIKCSFDDSLTKFVKYRGENAGEEFVRRLETDILDIYNKYLKNVVPMKPLSVDEIKDFMSARVCSICDETFKTDDVKVRDHCHLTGYKRPGAAHSNCNLNYKIPKFVPIFSHNMTGYDGHLFIKQLYKEGERSEVIAQNKEKYISFTKPLHTHNYVDKDGKMRKNYLNLRFLDSFRFLASSLDELSKNLPSQNFIETRKKFSDVEKFELMRQKGVFPYSFIDSIDKLEHDSLPSKDQFYDKLREQHISDEEYARAMKVWRLFNCSIVKGDYSDVNLTSDVLILSDIFENFREVAMTAYKLDPAQYFTSPGLSWDAMLRYTKVELELLTDIDMINFFKKGIRGGISQCVGRKHTANNPHLPNYNPLLNKSYISYLDATNLYGYSMSQTLPTGEFTWLSQVDINNLDILSIGDDDNYGYALEVDVLYPYNLHDEHADLPFLAENIVPPNSKSKINKLIPNLSSKEKYIIHYRSLKQALDNGLILTKVHRVLKFKQSQWLKKYVDLNTEMRNKAYCKIGKKSIQNHG